MEDPKIVRIDVSFTDEDFSHCISCINFVKYLLDSESDNESLSISLDDVEYLAILLDREYQIMCEVIQVSEGSNNVI